MMTYTKLLRFDTFEERLNYLKLDDGLFEQTNHFRTSLQKFYKSSDWLRTRKNVIVRDYGLDLGLVEISGRIIVHHMNPITPIGLLRHPDVYLDPEFLITVSHRTHQIIHYGVEGPSVVVPSERYQGDTRLW